MPSEHVLALKASYQNGEVSIGDALVRPCLGECILYRRGTGYFNSSALIHYADVLDYVIRENVKIEIICSPKIDQTLLSVLEKNANLAEKQRIEVVKQEAERILLVALGHSKNPKNISYRERLLTYFLANGQLEIKFAVPRHIDANYPSTDDRNLYHVKTGYFKFPDGSWVSFDGSFNESDGGMRWNTDRTQVFRSWKDSDQERGLDVMESVDKDWTGANPHISTFGLERSTLDLIKRMSEKSRPKRPLTEETFSPSLYPKAKVVNEPRNIYGLWKHQEKAVDIFLERKHGILEMATGTGKTRTAMVLLEHLLKTQSVKSVILATEGNDLLDQWFRQLSKLSYERGGLYNLFAHYGPVHRDINRYLLDGYRSNSVLVVSNENLVKVLRNLDDQKKSKLLLIHDEVHRIGSPANREMLETMSDGIGWTLGLSATPDREYDDDGNAFINSYIGEVIFSYGLEDAINDKILCPFDYVPLSYTPSVADKQKVSAIYSRKKASELSGKPMTDVELYIAISKVYKLSEEKLAAFSNFLRTNSDVLKRSIIFVEEKWFGDKVIELIHPYRADFHTYYAEDEKETLNRFARGDLECLITCHKLSEGIDIQSLKTVILFSSARARLETIQRIGRCLRVNPSDQTKVAKVIDFVRDDVADDDSDAMRSAWLSAVSKVRPKEEVHHGNR